MDDPEREAFDLAKRRVDGTPALKPYTDLLLEYFWREADHYAWVASAPLHELLSWCRTARAKGGG